LKDCATSRVHRQASFHFVAILGTPTPLVKRLARLLLSVDSDNRKAT
jgi:hypothetical protein